MKAIKLLFQSYPSCPSVCDVQSHYVQPAPSAFTQIVVLLLLPTLSDRGIKLVCYLDIYHILTL